MSFDRTTSTTVCLACAHLLVPFKDAPHWRWLCQAKKLAAVYNPLTGQNDKFEPYERCKDVNGGDCPFYAPGPNKLRPRATADGEVIEA